MYEEKTAEDVVGRDGRKPDEGAGCENAGRQIVDPKNSNDGDLDTSSPSKQSTTTPSDESAAEPVEYVEIMVDDLLFRLRPSPEDHQTHELNGHGSGISLHQRNGAKSNGLDRQHQASLRDTVELAPLGDLAQEDRTQ